ncbi:MAG: hypothetical protein F6K40_34550 [Okeania sp. SIO3I5]|uniref:hypothetical protein n=1 Tax=Okeania sp. SIO3I5 TaxID=2607805 RepID=UPI0013B9BC5A|nr:hypothetical protein [Okeania sp. SIO3I5]NEQ41059.1 hypothetical protein [Okeania sp. SIO3I5]
MVPFIRKGKVGDWNRTYAEPPYLVEGEWHSPLQMVYNSVCVRKSCGSHISLFLKLRD